MSRKGEKPLISARVYAALCMDREDHVAVKSDPAWTEKVTLSLPCGFPEDADFRERSPLRPVITVIVITAATFWTHTCVTCCTHDAHTLSVSLWHLCLTRISLTIL